MKLMGALTMGRKSEFEKKFKEKQSEAKKLGEGKYGEVYLVHFNGEDVAVKVVNKSKLKTVEERTFMDSEIRIHKSLDHPHIVKFYDTFQDKNNLYLVVELMSGGEVFSKIFNHDHGNHYTERKAALLARNLASALDYLHKRNIVHRDLKPENLLLYSNNTNEEEAITNIKLCDFGVASYCEPGEKLHSPYGTLMYIAPEILKSEPYRTEVDMWSFGVVLYCLLFGQPPFYSPDEPEMAQMIVSRELRFDENAKVSEEAKDLLSSLLEREVEERYSAEDVLEHEWIVNAQSKDKTMDELVLDDVGQKFNEFKTKMLIQQAVHGVRAIGRLQYLLSDIKKN